MMWRREHMKRAIMALAMIALGGLHACKGHREQPAKEIKEMPAAQDAAKVEPEREQGDELAQPDWQGDPPGMPK